MAAVDIIVPAYNSAHFLPQALDSVIAQTFTDWRILLVDDGSQDSTPALAATYQDRLGDKLMYIRQPNGGLPAARNMAIRHATAELLALLDADDVWLPERLAESVKAFEGRPEVGLAYGFNDRIDPDGRVLDSFTRRNKHAEGSVAPYIYMRRLDLPCPTVTFRRSAVEAVGPFDETMRSTEDRDLWVRIALRYKVALVPRLLAHYRVSPQAMSADTGRMLASQRQFIAKHFGAPGCGRYARRVALSWAYRQRAESLADAGDRSAAARAVLQSVGYYPFATQNLRAAASILWRWFRSGLRRRPLAVR